MVLEATSAAKLKSPEAQVPRPAALNALQRLIEGSRAEGVCCCATGCSGMAPSPVHGSHAGPETGCPYVLRGLFSLSGLSNDCAPCHSAALWRPLAPQSLPTTALTARASRLRLALPPCVAPDHLLSAVAILAAGGWLQHLIEICPAARRASWAGNGAYFDALFNRGWGPWSTTLCILCPMFPASWLPLPFRCLVQPLSLRPLAATSRLSLVFCFSFCLPVAALKILCFRTKIALYPFVPAFL